MIKPGNFAKIVTFLKCAGEKYENPILFWKALIAELSFQGIHTVRTFLIPYILLDLDLDLRYTCTSIQRTPIKATKLSVEIETEADFTTSILKTPLSCILTSFGLFIQKRRCQKCRIEVDFIILYL